ncbi:hypothetical protein B0T17DRAFT_203472 [Bombardia bombarda]|uniref:Uncharacterized protein n=1 Tax=Bombardia bombarda TaxID=252184 RepID=A0AA39X9Q8_9PEZI|nr:hypothetical protein B0T17DRAFT_203472 [Bombardia bombarda]
MILYYVRQLIRNVLLDLWKLVTELFGYVLRSFWCVCLLGVSSPCTYYLVLNIMFIHICVLLLKCMQLIFDSRHGSSRGTNGST